MRTIRSPMLHVTNTPRTFAPLLRHRWGNPTVDWLPPKRPHVDPLALLEPRERLLRYDDFVETANAAIAEAASAGTSVALLVADVDRFARVGEVHGNAAAEAILRSLLELICRTLRERDVASHPGGDEIVVLLRGATAAEGREVGERLCSAVRGHDFAGIVDDLRLTISVGVAGAPEHGSTYAPLHAAADAARVRLKAQGRDGAAVASVSQREPGHRPLDIDRFAGRVEELRTIVGLLDEVVAGRPRVVAVLGEPGSGTATLIRRLEPEVRLRGGSLVRGRARDADVREPYLVWRGVLRHLSRLPGAPTQSWRELHYLLPLLPGEDGAETGSGTKYRLLEELSAYVRQSAAGRPLVILLDEMQWADVASWDALEHVIEQLDTERVLICLAIKSDAAFVEANDRRTGLARFDIYQEVMLSRLTREEVKRWLEAVFHNQEIGREFLAFLYRHTEGNPLFLSELLRTLVDEGAIQHNGTRWTWSPVSELQLPAGLPALLSRRIARFSASTQAVLATAATMGREFDVPLVVAAGAGSEAAVQLALSEALASGVIRPTYERGAGGYTFANDRVVDVLAGAIAPERLRSLHERVAAALDKRPGASEAEIALHFDHAGIAAEAYAHALTAAGEAERLYAHVAATELLHVAVRNATSPGELAEVRVRLATLAESVGRYDEAEELCDLAIEWFAGQGDSRRALTLRRMRERARKELGQPARVTLEALLALDDEARRLDSRQECVAIATMLSQTYQRLGDPRAAERTAREGVRMAEEIEDATLLGEALNRLATTVYQESPVRAREIYLRALDLFERTGDVRGQARCHINLGAIALHGSNWDAAREEYGQAIALSRAAGMPDLWGTAALNLGVIAHRNGDYDRARELFGEALALFAAVKNSELQLYALYNLAHIDWESAAWESAAELYEATASLAQRIGADDVEIGASAGVGLCLFELGRVEGARGAYAEVEARMRNRSDWFQGREFAEALAVRYLLSNGQVDDAVTRFEAAAPMAEGIDLYSAAWLTSVCGRALAPAAADRLRQWVDRYATRVESLGYTEMSRQLRALPVA